MIATAPLNGIDLVGSQREIFDIETAIAEPDIAVALQRDLMKAAGIERNADGPPKIDGPTALFASGSELDVAVDVDEIARDRETSAIRRIADMQVVDPGRIPDLRLGLCRVVHSIQTDIGRGQADRAVGCVRAPRR